MTSAELKCLASNCHRCVIALTLALILLSAPSTSQTFEGRKYLLTPGSGRGPLILALHGTGGSGLQLRLDTPIDKAAAASGATVVFPDGPERRWNDGRWSGLNRPDTAARNDAQYLLRLADHLQSGQVDRRVFVIGHSNGGGMALLLACTSPKRFSGIAIVASKLLVDAPCKAPSPVPMILFHGTEDRIAPHDGHRSARQIARSGAILSSDATLAELARRNRCEGTSRVRRLPALTTSGIIPVINTASGCAAPLQRVVLVGGGHSFPGGASRPLLALLGGPEVPDFNAAASAMVFFKLAPINP